MFVIRSVSWGLRKPDLTESGLEGRMQTDSGCSGSFAHVGLHIKLLVPAQSVNGKPGPRFVQSDLAKRVLRPAHRTTVDRQDQIPRLQSGLLGRTVDIQV